MAEASNTTATTGTAQRETKHAAREGAAVARAALAETADAARDTMEQTHDTARQGLKAATEARGQIVEIYRDTTESTVGEVQALVQAFSQLGRGVQEMQHAWLDLLERSVTQASHRPQELLRCGSPIELAETQREIYRDGLTYMLDATSILFTVMGETAKRAHGTLDGRRP